MTEGNETMRALIAVGRSTLAVAALLTVVAFTAFGVSYGQARDMLSGFSVPPGQVSTTVASYALLGFAVGVVAAGSTFGLAAAIYDMQRSLRLLVDRGRLGTDEGDRPSPAGPAGQRIEPQLRA